MLTPARIEAYLKQLESDRTRVLGEIQRIEKPENFGNDTEDFSEKQDEAEALITDLAAGQALRERVSEIDSALNKIRMGTYGTCEKCKQPISEKELDIIPETRLCEHCKSNRK